MHSGVARAFPGGRVAHPKGQNGEENKKILRKIKKNWMQFEEKWGKWNSCLPGTGRLATPLQMKPFWIPRSLWEGYKSRDIILTLPNNIVSLFVM